MFQEKKFLDEGMNQISVEICCFLDPNGKTKINIVQGYYWKILEENRFTRSSMACHSKPFPTPSNLPPSGWQSFPFQDS